ncbi:recombinase family protein [Nocardia panacis]|uniref:Recombinase family protein n=1 Tax=Nocardia panacis TaxID=2340916 RepID=A0A3A4KVS3_9NOCA|nr:recombinase family protein [Nocardia panacis]RJO79340.1 recombinase family protein [Nocardia panacis]
MRSKALVGKRVSVYTDRKVSHDAQGVTTHDWCKRADADVVADFEDLGVSAIKVNTFDRPDLGSWLTEDRAEEWDTIAWAKVDRAWRSMRDGLNFMHWAEDHRKRVVFVDDGLEFDYRNGRKKGDFQSAVSDMFMLLLSMFAQIEGERFIQRSLDAHGVLKNTDRWAGGAAPFGFAIVDHPSGGRRLAKDADQQEVLHKLAGLFVNNGWSYSRLAGWLNDSGVLSNQAAARQKGGKSVSTRPWQDVTVKRLLTSPATQGLKVVNMQPDPEKRQKWVDTDYQVATDPTTGEPIRMADATFDAETWAKIQARVAERTIAPRRRTEWTNRIAGIVACDCGAAFSRSPGGGEDYYYYRCSRGRGHACKGRTVRNDILDSAVRDFFLEGHLASRAVTHRRWVPGSDRSEEYEQVQESIRAMRRNSEKGYYKGDEAEYEAKMDALIAKREQIESEGIVAKGQYVTEDTGKTWGDLFRESEDWAVVQKAITDAGIRLIIEGTYPLIVRVDDPSERDGIPYFSVEMERRKSDSRSQSGRVWQAITDDPGATDKALAERLGVTAVTVGRWRRKMPATPVEPTRKWNAWLEPHPVGPEMGDTSTLVA